MTKLCRSVIAIRKFWELHLSKAEDGLRLGQRFHNMYLKEPILVEGKDLFYMDQGTALITILGWLEDNQYYDTLPEEVVVNQ